MIEMKTYEDTLEEIYLERARYLLSTDELLEEMLGDEQGKKTSNMNLEYCSEAGTVRCGELADSELVAEQVNNPSISAEIDLSIK